MKSGNNFNGIISNSLKDTFKALTRDGTFRIYS